MQAVWLANDWTELCRPRQSGQWCVVRIEVRFCCRGGGTHLSTARVLYALLNASGLARKRCDGIVLSSAVRTVVRRAHRGPLLLRCASYPSQYLSSFECSTECKRFGSQTIRLNCAVLDRADSGASCASRS